MVRAERGRRQAAPCRRADGADRSQERAHVCKGAQETGLCRVARYFQGHEIPRPAPRTEAPTAVEVTAARKAAHELGHASAAFAYALQFEGSARQWDVVGKWVPLADKKASSILDGTSKWIGPMWSQIDEHLIFRYTPAKTEFTSGAKVVLDLKQYPMVMEELVKVPDEARHGPLIVNPRTGLPYRNWYYGRVWDKVRKITGIPKEIWNRDMRAGGVTEARQGNAPVDDVAKTVGDTKRTTAKVYDRDTLESSRRVATARKAYRGKNTE